MTKPPKQVRTEYAARLVEANERLKANPKFQQELVNLIRKYEESQLADYAEKRSVSLMPSRLPTQNVHDKYDDLADRKIRYDAMRIQDVPKDKAIQECFKGIGPDEIKRVVQSTWRQVRERVAEKKKLAQENSADFQNLTPF